MNPATAQTSFDVFMAGPGWALFSIVAAFFTGAFYLVNQYLKQPGYVLVFWMRVLIVLVMTPFMLRMNLPVSPSFYWIVALSALVGVTADVRTLNVSAKYGGGVVSRLMPMTVWGSFILWFFVKPELLVTYAAHPLHTAGILLALGGCIFFAMRLNRCAITKSALKEIMPALVGYTVSVLLNKVGIDDGYTKGSFTGAVYGYMYVQSICGVVLIGPYAIWMEKRMGAKSLPWRNTGMLLASLLGMIFWIALMTAKNYAMAYTPNPSFQAALNLTAPLFVAGFYFLTRHKEDADVKSGMGIVACAVILALLAQG